MVTILCGYLILVDTFCSSQKLGGRLSLGALVSTLPLGAFITAWGGIALITSASFDNWWHSAYSLDAAIVSRRAPCLQTAHCEACSVKRGDLKKVRMENRRSDSRRQRAPQFRSAGLFVGLGTLCWIDG